MKLSKIKIVFLSFVLFILIVYSVNYIKLFLDTRHIDTSPEASIEQYLKSNTNDYQIKSINIKEQEFRNRIYTVECDCSFKNEQNRGNQRYYFYLIDDLGWIVAKHERIAE
ncbi:hypothetical protein BC351_04485 [Paenibacillus ferrarius]|uniref:DUF3139 domain-containing protein n=1 Tax=Paenibacillus ferrarius TaxID=1469647 RepID=A0A1V4HKJ0_9BACL|nr:hypothetical protein [Paenibacillus ferrarius]OPH57770.1 hypothetical protein BC351_04485 [Paenibacillus ferrarius]